MGKIKFIGAQVVERKIKKPSNAKILCFSNYKGGVGKSTSAQAVSEALAYAGYKVLGIDLDIQSSFSNNAALKLPDDTITMRQMYDYIMEGNSPTKELVHRMIGTSNGDYDMMKSDVDMINMELEYGHKYGNSEKLLFLLKYIIEEIRDEYHYIIIDTQPNLSMLTRHAYCVADELLVPMEPNTSSTDGLGLLLYMFNEIKEKYNPKLEMGGIFFTMVEDGATPRNTIADMCELSDEIQVPILQSFIRTAKIYDTLKAKRSRLCPHLFKNPQMAQYLLLVNEITGTLLFKLLFVET